MPRKQHDPILEHSASLCQYMNGQPTIVLSYARFFGEYPNGTNATMTSIDSDGFDIVCKDNGEEREVRVAFGYSIHAISQVKTALMTLAKEAELGLRDDPNGQVGTKKRN
ncbi:hypothetical protein BGZ76_000753 [Entomortierella beljakovae]|nr:hypothetical protein BGZ76_000753 [Entomortierella beljakovae]